MPSHGLSLRLLFILCSALPASQLFRSTPEGSGHHKALTSPTFIKSRLHLRLSFISPSSKSNFISLHLKFAVTVLPYFRRLYARSRSSLCSAHRKFSADHILVRYRRNTIAMLVGPADKARCRVLHANAPIYIMQPFQARSPEDFSCLLISGVRISRIHFASGQLELPNRFSASSIVSLTSALTRWFRFVSQKTAYYWQAS